MLARRTFLKALGLGAASLAVPVALAAHGPQHFLVPDDYTLLEAIRLARAGDEIAIIGGEYNPSAKELNSLLYGPANFMARHATFLTRGRIDFGKWVTTDSPVRKLLHGCRFPNIELYPSVEPWRQVDWGPAAFRNCAVVSGGAPRPARKAKA